MRARISDVSIIGQPMAIPMCVWGLNFIHTRAHSNFIPLFSNAVYRGILKKSNGLMKCLKIFTLKTWYTAQIAFYTARVF